MLSRAIIDFYTVIILSSLKIIMKSKISSKILLNFMTFSRLNETNYKNFNWVSNVVGKKAVHGHDVKAPQCGLHHICL